MNRVYVITDAKSRRRLDWRGVLAGVWAVLVLVTSAVDHYLAAVFGIPPLAWCTRQVARVVRDAYRRGRYGPPSTCTSTEYAVFEFEVLDDTEPVHHCRKDT